MEKEVIIGIENVNPENYFWTKDGRQLKNLYDLRDTLKVLDYSTFNHHVNNERNDFCNWIKFVMNNEELAEKINKTKRQKQIIKILNKGIKNLEKGSSNKIQIFDEKRKFMHRIKNKIHTDNQKIEQIKHETPKKKALITIKKSKFIKKRPKYVSENQVVQVTELNPEMKQYGYGLIIGGGLAIIFILVIKIF